MASATSQAAPNNIEVTTRPALSSVRPLKDPVEITLRLANRGSGIPPDTVFHVRLLAPLPQAFWSTDFPLIEGTELFNVSVPAPKGEAALHYIFPIRGSYRLEVAAGRGGAKSTVSLEIQENRVKLAVLAAFLVGLFLLGFVAGRVFTGRGGTVAMFLLVFLAPVPYRLAQGGGVPDRRGGKIAVSAARVGTPSRIRWTFAGRAEAPIELAIGITQVEKGKEVFRLEKVNPRGPFEFRFQFVDASPHRVRAVATIGGNPPMVAEQIVNVSAPDPPRWQLARVLLYFLSVVAVGLILGRMSRRRYERTGSPRR